jgi:hypothetical protein
MIIGTRSPEAKNCSEKTMKKRIDQEIYNVDFQIVDFRDANGWILRILDMELKKRT